MKKLDIFKFTQKIVDHRFENMKNNEEFAQSYTPKTSKEINSALVLLRFLSKFTLQY